MAETETGRPCIHQSRWQHSTPAMSQSCPPVPEALCPSLFFSLSLSLSLSLHVPSLALNWWDSQDNRLWRLQRHMHTYRTRVCVCGLWKSLWLWYWHLLRWELTHEFSVSCKRRARLGSSLFCCHLFLWRFYFLNSHSVNSYIFRSPDVYQTHRSIVSIGTTSVTRKLIARSGFHIIKSVPKSHSHRHQHF